MSTPAMETSVVGRLAPSPTGGQHLGNARTYLIAWLSARTQGGKVVLRLEDLDAPRVKPGAVQQALDDLRWLGIDWDVGPIFQTDRLDRYQAAFERLKAAELVYPCTCSRADVARAASAPHAEHEGLIYPGTCASRCVADAAKIPGQFAWRVRTAGARMPFIDRFRGLIDLSLRDLGGDFVVWRVGGPPAYQLAVVVDDAEQGVTEVIRGDDLIPSTPRQLLLYQLLGLNPPTFSHVPLVVDATGRRLAKRDHAICLTTMREAGETPDRLLGTLAWSCGWLEKPEPIGARELLPLFRWETIPRQPFCQPSLAGEGS